LPRLVEDAHALLENNFVFHQDGAPAQGAMRTQEWLGEHCADIRFMASKQPGFKSAGLLCMGNTGALLEEFNKSKTTEHF